MKRDPIKLDYAAEYEAAARERAKAKAAAAAWAWEQAAACFDWAADAEGLPAREQRVIRLATIVRLVSVFGTVDPDRFGKRIPQHELAERVVRGCAADHRAGRLERVSLQTNIGGESHV